MKRVIIVGGGFAGLQAAKTLGGVRDVDVTLLDARNYHLFQPLLYQVATAGLGAEAIAVPIRSLLARYRNVGVLRSAATEVQLQKQQLVCDAGVLGYDYLLLACGSQDSYFGHPEWEERAPGLKTVAQALEIRRRILDAFEEAEKASDPAQRRALLTFVVVGGGPTGVELAGAIGEISRYALARDFRHIDPKLSRILLLEAGPRILAPYPEALASRAVRDLESLGVQVWTSSAVTQIGPHLVEVGDERVQCGTVLWAAGVSATPLNHSLGLPLDRHGRVSVEADLSLPGHREVFVLGDQAHALGANGEPLPGLAPVAQQQGRFAAQQILADLAGQPRGSFRYRDRGQLATIGRARAVGQLGRLQVTGVTAWLLWLAVHIFSLIGFRNRLLVLIQWAWAYVRFRSGARLIIEEDWRSQPRDADGRLP